MKRVVVGLSGGVDSSVSAYLLQQQGYEVIGLFMKNWHDESVILDAECPWVEDSNDALIVAQTLGIPFQTIDLSAAYKERIVDYMFAEYQAGRTPNPDVLCNREIKFDVFLKTALELGADYVATGHYCQKKEVQKDGSTQYQLIAGADNNKDQSYFLCQLNQAQLAKALFPIGHLQKPEVRKIAAEQGLITAEKKDSQGLCFVGKIKLPDFLQQQLKPKKGDIIEIPKDAPIFQNYQEQVEAIGDNRNAAALKILSKAFVYAPQDGKVVGQHNGAHYFTIGQRKGLQVGGTPEPLFVVATDTRSNLIYTGQGAHPGLFRKGLFIANNEVHWVRPDLKLAVGEQRDFMVRIRYRQPLTPATLYCTAEGIYIIFETQQRGVTPGQFAAWYEHQELIGSGVIG
ncbi:tRNA 2-thiouridine(34) synthase MnmA [Aureispira anguillae]|uniref:tRNA-specific 2-thiouridylase MnmA n=1 Tax=Aureispira anguillae TaxID=2864201 RepID=A0A915YG98_9BACT|nr:tRNA 2-thiouridine(34) synthase MnmA [Aureispira anguillae]BDS12480.1 tRNA 2-thiouridine(34) synthase MnmA [Aureispira anguillae]